MTNSLSRNGVTIDLFAVELHEIEAAKSSGILVLPAAFDSHIVAFNVVGQFSHPRRM